MKATLDKGKRNGALMVIVLFLFGTYQIFSQGNYIPLENWGEYIFAPLYFVVPAGGVIVAIRNIFSAGSWQAKLLWFAVFITSAAYLAALVYDTFTRN
jgi:hypothetical protein